MRVMINYPYVIETLAGMRRGIIAKLAETFVVVDVCDACISADSSLAQSKAGRHLDLFAEPHVQVFGLSGETVLPNTVFMVVYDPEGRFCNVECKKYLYTQGVTIGIGSACLTNHAGASHIAEAYRLNKLQKRGLLRLSFISKTPNIEDAINKLSGYVQNIFKMSQIC